MSAEKIWSCKIGGDMEGDLPDGADLPMRQAVQAAFHSITGTWADFTFSGWDAELTESQRLVVEDGKARGQWTGRGA